ncbi:SprT-like domain-containing protein [Methylomonas sp. AM2-LC]|uniref:SprT-like domain-containing protein n=1 Tax=Methylomonas sp. AM2-LC TaxID=3153301 RepID=UPI0032640852
MTSDNRDLLDPSSQFYSTLTAAFNHFNETLFDSKLPPVIFVTQRKKNVMGHYSYARWRNDTKYCDELAVNPTYFAKSALIDLLSLLVHELCHEWQAHFGNPGRRGYHNREWSRKMQSIGLMPSDTGKEGGAKTGEKMSDYIIPRGKFIIEAGNLVSSGFFMPWIDRYSVSRKLYLPTIPPRYGKPERIMEAIESKETPLETSTSIENPSKIKNMLESMGLNDKAAEILSVDLESLLSAEDNPSGVEIYPPRNFKTKYTCPVCSVNIWGRPKLDVLCITCNIQFIEI